MIVAPGLTTMISTIGAKIARGSAGVAGFQPAAERISQARDVGVQNSARVNIAKNLHRGITPAKVRNDVDAGSSSPLANIEHTRKANAEARRESARSLLAA